jgi:ketosteroid isomerase-like protein
MVKTSLFLLGSVLLAAGAGAQLPSAKEAEELETLEHRLVAAIGARDLEAYDAMVAADYVVIEAAGTVRTKADVMASYRSGDRGYRDLKIDEVKAHVFGDTAVVHARTSGLRLVDGKEERNRVRYVRVYARRGGRWQAVAQMSTPLPAEQP